MLSVKQLAIMTSAVALVCAAETAVATDEASLKGLRSLWIVVERFDSEMAQAGFSTRLFKTDAELKLRMAGIEVAPSEKSAPASLYVNVQGLHNASRTKAAYSISVSLHQPVRVLGNNAVVDASTWESSGVGFGSLSSVRRNVKDVLDEFLNDWLSANPKN